MKKCLFFLIMLTGWLMRVQAQSVYQDVIYLKSGGVIKGELVSIDNAVLKVRTHNDSQTELSMEDVQRIVKQPCNTLATDSIKPSRFKGQGMAVFHEIGYGNSTGMLRTSRGSFNYISQSYTFLTGVGVHVAEHALLALGTGYGQLTPDRKIVPLFAELRTHILHQPLSPYLLLRTGYSMGWRDSLSGADWGGAMFEAAAGIRIHLTWQHALYAHVGFQQQQQRIELINLITRNIWSEKANYQFWGFRIGVLF
ncbi:MAG: hypothetical protein RMJ87_06315 [Cytophagales bacterium]|nr:hypothetical protein [Bernardetiaceae bacterium]MDW8204625.1 hypothetical protein [Cytophagales bacterium]